MQHINTLACAPQIHTLKEMDLAVDPSLHHAEGCGPGHGVLLTLSDTYEIRDPWRCLRKFELKRLNPNA